MANNKITTLGYFKKRLKDSGYRCEEVFRKYSHNDPRAWTIMIDPSGASVLCTCYINCPSRGDVTIELFDGGQFIPGRFKVTTNSIEVVMEKLNTFNIIDKRLNYSERS